MKNTYMCASIIIHLKDIHSGTEGDENKFEHHLNNSI